MTWRKRIGAILIVTGWIVYVGTTSYIVWLMLTGHTPLFLKEYTLGRNAGWVMIGIRLCVATEWFREFSDRS